MLKVGDTIKCSDEYDCVNTSVELAKAGVNTDFVYKKNEEQGLWLEVIEVCKD